tara:strand:- start:1690 stop:1884 length:195 start_codon:yes stop_codon:yes gene_type:complete
MKKHEAIADRAVRTIAQTAVALIGSAAVLDAVDWQTVLSGSMLAGLLSVLTSISTTLPEVKPKS